jgi:hypothetical protein
MRTITLKKGYFALVDDEDYPLISQYNWGVSIRRTGVVYAIARIKGKTVLMHRLIMKARKGRIIDHKNRNGLDNRRANLRFCTYTQNCMNRSKTTKNKLSGYKGVWFEAKKWRANIRINNKTKHLGSFETEVEAALAYNAAAVELFGEFACINEIEERAAA